MRADGILFDKDGTLFDFAATWEAWAVSLLKRISMGDEARAHEFGRAIGFDYSTGKYDANSVAIAGTPDDLFDAMLPLMPGVARPELIRIIDEEAEAAPTAEAVPLAPFLDGLRGMGLKLGVATNDAEIPARAHLAAAGVTERFDFIAGYDSGHGAKPAPGMCLGFAQSVSLEPARVVMVGDSLHDLHAGRAAGMQVVGVLTGMATADDLAPHADAVLPDIGHLPGWLAQ